MIHLVIGTRAQLLKMAPVMRECEERRSSWRWIYTAQHNETIKGLLHTFELREPDYVVKRWSTEAKTLGSMARWLFSVVPALLRGRQILGGHTGPAHIVLTHGDTFTTWWGALLGRLYGCRVLHVEAGLRSFRAFSPFPEELNRLATFRLAHDFACPGEWACANLSRYKGHKLDTGMNTQIDTLRYGLTKCEGDDFQCPLEPYAIASVHRYENIFRRGRFERTIELLELVAERFLVLFVLHPATALQLEKLGLLERIKTNDRMILVPRMGYLAYLKAATHARFVLTDGGGNQEELYFMGKPTLLLRNETERPEGLGETAVLSKYDPATVESFLDNLESYRREPIEPRRSPAAMIVDFLEQRGHSGT